ncbi:MAG: response regulator transcription factor [Anaerolineae bacterium]|nr:response regulator transcription factor [Anaerolineae bacterium]
MTEFNHILVIEDDPGVGASLKDGLERNGFIVTWRKTGAEGLQAACDDQVHLTLLDLRLPDGSGLDVCRQLRRMGRRLPVIILTVQNEEIDKVLALEIGADDYVTKPFSLRELVSRIRAQLRRAYGELSGASSDALYVHDLVVDLSSGRVKRGEADVALTPVEFRLLVYLARHRGQALSRSQIVEAVWGHTPDLDAEHAINVHIRRLREKVEPDPARPTLVLTVPGIGYRLA